MADNRDPIFFAWTRSFWLGIFPAIMTAIEVAVMAFADPSTSGPAAALISVILGGVSLIPWFDWVAATPDQVQAFMVGISPIYAMIVGQQRAHAARPYTIDPRALK